MYMINNNNNNGDVFKDLDKDLIERDLLDLLKSCSLMLKKHLSVDIETEAACLMPDYYCRNYCPFSSEYDLFDRTCGSNENFTQVSTYNLTKRFIDSFGNEKKLELI